MYRYLRPLLFRLDAEDAHGWGMKSALLGQRTPGTVRRLFGYEDTLFPQM